MQCLSKLQEYFLNTNKKILKFRNINYHRENDFEKNKDEMIAIHPLDFKDY